MEYCRGCVWGYLGERDECSLQSLVVDVVRDLDNWWSGYCKSPVLSEAGVNLGSSELCGISHYSPQQQLPGSKGSDSCE